MERGKKAIIKNLLYLLSVVWSAAAISACKEPGGKALVFETGPVVFLRLGGVIESFNIVVEEVGDKPIKEYGVVYAFDSVEIVKEPDLTDRKAVFTEPLKVGGIRQEVKVGYPVTTKCIVCRAYAEFRDGSVQYAKGQKLIF